MYLYPRPLLGIQTLKMEMGFCTWFDYIELREKLGKGARVGSGEGSGVRAGQCWQEMGIFQMPGHCGRRNRS